MALTGIIANEMVKQLIFVLFVCFRNSDFDDMPSTLMGQFMEALNNPSNLEDLGFNIDGFQEGLECNVDEVNDFFSQFNYNE